MSTMDIKAVIGEVGLGRAADLIHDKYGELPSDFPAFTFEDWLQIHGSRFSELKELALRKMEEQATSSHLLHRFHYFVSDKQKPRILRKIVRKAVAHDDWDWIVDNASGKLRKKALRKRAKLVSTIDQRWAAYCRSKGRSKKIVWQGIVEATAKFGFWDWLHMLQSHKQDELGRLAFREAFRLAEGRFVAYERLWTHVSEKDKEELLRTMEKTEDQSFQGWKSFLFSVSCDRAERVLQNMFRFKGKTVESVREVYLRELSWLSSDHREMFAMELAEMATEHEHWEWIDRHHCVHSADGIKLVA